MPKAKSAMTKAAPEAKPARPESTAAKSAIPSAKSPTVHSRWRNDLGTGVNRFCRESGTGNRSSRGWCNSHGGYGERTGYQKSRDGNGGNVFKHFPVFLDVLVELARRFCL
jgi:hypothetical protein